MELLAVFVVIARLSVCFILSQTTARTVFQIKNAIWRESCPRKNRIGVCGFDFPVIHRPPVRKRVV